MSGLELFGFLVSIVSLSLTGILMPGPVTAVTMARGAHSPHAGAWVAIGHGVLELPLMAFIYFFSGAIFHLASVKVGIGVVGGLLLLWMAVGMLRDYDKVGAPGEEVYSGRFTKSPFMAGIFLSAGNPYFLVWWATVGAALIGKSLAMGVVGFVVLAAVHWLCDFIWYYFLSALSFSGGKFFGQKLQRGVFIVCGLALLYFSGSFLMGAIFTLS